jgi:hypothetical protein
MYIVKSKFPDSYSLLTFLSKNVVIYVFLVN